MDALQSYWEVCPQLRRALFKDNRPGYLDLVVAKDSIKRVIYEHPEFVVFIGTMNELFACWQQRSASRLKSLQPGFHPKKLIHELAEDLLAHYTGKPLIDKYDVYQHLMDYWAETMQDDCYLIAADGWKAETYRIIQTNKNGNEVDKGWACDLIPRHLVINRYFAAEKEVISEQETELESLNARLNELEEEHCVEEGALSSVSNKADALIAWQDALVAVWQSWDSGNYDQYTKAVVDQETSQHRLLELESDPRIQALVNGKGKITQAAINARLKAASDSDEREQLELHKATSTAFKEAKERARVLLDSATARIHHRLHAEPDNQGLGEEDLRDLRVIREYLALIEQISDLKKASRGTEAKLNALVYARYPDAD